ncbi:hypothetical protein CWO07_24180 [Vibrio splendidus]|uniref:NUMOD4 domain-containing protein n=1 Tax=Vibrio splendidus TaxID=29497 RepID=A0A2T5EJ84_VIBSP|nr:NUMOD4 domain-containing protein [Vibrio splendidus]PTP20212.1 hypothetical protein CWO07_24180 [Vibrio splendidus]
MKNNDCPLFGRDVFYSKPKPKRKEQKPKPVKTKYVYLPMKQRQIKVALVGVELLEGEEWAIIPQAPDYIVSNYGRVYNMKAMRLIKHYIRAGRSTHYVRLRSTEGKRLTLSIHKLTYELFGSSYIAHLDDDERSIDVNIGYGAPYISDEAPY